MDALLRLVDELTEHGDSMPFHQWEREIVLRLRAEIPHYSWVGFYWVVKDKLVLGAWDGPEATEHVLIPVGEGICGLAARIGETVIVDDVNQRSEYLACFPQTRSEIVVPIMRRGIVIGELDIDSDTPAAFTEDDKYRLERLAQMIADRHPGM